MVWYLLFEIWRVMAMVMILSGTVEPARWCKNRSKEVWIKGWIHVSWYLLLHCHSSWNAWPLKQRTNSVRVFYYVFEIKWSKERIYVKKYKLKQKKKECINYMKPNAYKWNNRQSAIKNIFIFLFIQKMEIEIWWKNLL